jgi:hypothetical protein
MQSEINERVFEFAYNAEFANTHSSILLSAPSMPSQVQEKGRPYDVKFRLKGASGKGWSLMLQHKVVRHVSGKSPSNTKWIKQCGLPYFAFPLDTQQYNRIVEYRKRRRSIFYCAPRFSDRTTLERHYAKRTVCDGAVWIDPIAAGPILDMKSHSIVFDTSASRVIRCSGDPIEIKTASLRGWMTESEPQELTEDVIVKLYDDLFICAYEWSEPRESVESPKADAGIRRGRPVRAVITSKESAAEAVADLSAEYFGASWLFVKSDAMTVNGTVGQ